MITLTKQQADLLINAMADAAEAAVEDERNHEGWRIDRFRTFGAKFHEIFNEPEVEEVTDQLE